MQYDLSIPEYQRFVPIFVQMYIYARVIVYKWLFIKEFHNLGVITKYGQIIKKSTPFIKACLRVFDLFTFKK